MSDQWNPPFVQMAEPAWDLICDQCGGEIDEGEDNVIELFLGKAGRGGKSGRAMVVEDSNISTPYTTLHTWCVEDFVISELHNDDSQREVYCAGCEAKLSGD